ncbi:MAG: hypothetical protein J7623_21080 [Chitinophaga sp.]|uniref:hypothetical protein n=1 Tax=Chitinophaga sp. TaxID=1869181 RepID=UPI001B20BECD|nr:hypothetical protein [Chitinophaga sp.]MBO9731145.1 hypothetical protein [Chitinophaga sp.]
MPVAAPIGKSPRSASSATDNANGYTFSFRFLPVAANRVRRMTNQSTPSLPALCENHNVCPHCMREDYDYNADYCKYCGTKPMLIER